MIDLRHSNDAAEIRDLAAQGFEPVECSIDGVSIVGPLVMDHHGELSHLEGVAVRAYRDAFGARVADPRFVVTGRADADATFAIAALAGRLPDRSTLDLTGLADLVNRLDTAPIGVDTVANPWGSRVLLWNELTRRFPQNAEAFYAGVMLWGRIAAADAPGHLLEAALAGERARLETARAAQVDFAQPPVRSVTSRVWGFDVWYGLRGDPSHATGWDWPVVLVLDPEMGEVTIGCPGVAIAEELFGPGGLKRVFPCLEPPGWGGREAIGGSPRGVRMDLEAAVRAAERVAGLVGTLRSSPSA
jgi:hypothetical protein